MSHSKLSFKLKLFGISSPLLNWFADYLCDHKQCVVVEGASLSFLNVTSGVLQGSVLGPHLLILYDNDLPEIINNSTVVLFADNTKCYCSIQLPDDCDFVQLDLNLDYANDHII